MLGLKLNHVSKMGPLWYHTQDHGNKEQQSTTLMLTVPIVWFSQIFVLQILDSPRSSTIRTTTVLMKVSSRISPTISHMMPPYHTQSEQGKPRYRLTHEICSPVLFWLYDYLLVASWDVYSYIIPRCVINMYCGWYKYSLEMKKQLQTNATDGERNTIGPMWKNVILCGI